MVAGMSRWQKFEKDSCIASKLRTLGTMTSGTHFLLHLQSAVYMVGTSAKPILKLPERNALRFVS